MAGGFHVSRETSAVPEPVIRRRTENFRRRDLRKNVSRETSARGGRRLATLQNNPMHQKIKQWNQEHDVYHFVHFRARERHDSGGKQGRGASKGPGSEVVYTSGQVIACLPIQLWEVRSRPT
jgi:hypothetical protein